MLLLCKPDLLLILLSSRFVSGCIVKKSGYFCDFAILLTSRKMIIASALISQYWLSKMLCNPTFCQEKKKITQCKVNQIQIQIRQSSRKRNTSFFMYCKKPLGRGCFAGIDFACSQSDSLILTRAYEAVMMAG